VIMQEGSADFILLIAVYVVMLLLGLPLVFKKVKPNLFYGFRVRATVENPDLWYKYNRLAGIGMLAIFTPTLGCLIYAFILAQQKDVMAPVLVNRSLWISTVLLLVFMLMTIVRVNREAKELKLARSDKRS